MVLSGLSQLHRVLCRTNVKWQILSWSGSQLAVWRGSTSFCSDYLPSGDAGVHDNPTAQEVARLFREFPAELRTAWLLRRLTGTGWAVTHETERERERWDPMPRGSNDHTGDGGEITQNSPQSLPSGITRTDQDGFIEEFVHTRYELWNTKKQNRVLWHDSWKTHVGCNK